MKKPGSPPRSRSRYKLIISHRWKYMLLYYPYIICIMFNIVLSSFDRLISLISLYMYTYIHSYICILSATASPWGFVLASTLWSVHLSLGAGACGQGPLPPFLYHKNMLHWAQTYSNLQVPVLRGGYPAAAHPFHRTALGC